MGSRYFLQRESGIENRALPNGIGHGADSYRDVVGSTLGRVPVSPLNMRVSRALETVKKG